MKKGMFHISRLFIYEQKNKFWMFRANGFIYEHIKNSNRLASE